MLRFVVRNTVSLALALALFLQVGVASARSQRNLAYRSEQAWTTAVRMLRVDLGFELVERDHEARFVLFTYEEGEHEFPGSLEVVERQLEDGRIGVRVIVSVPAMPAYIELHLIDRLERKLRDEIGAPIASVERPRPRRRSHFDRRGDVSEETEEVDDEAEDESDDDDDD